MLPLLQPLPLTRRPQPFSHPDWLFEVKYDGFRALAHCDPSGVRLVSRNGNRFSSFTTLCAGIEFALSLSVKHAVLDGEIACLDDQGHSHLNELLFRRGQPRFCAFDLLHLNGKDLRGRPLIERKRMLRRVVPTGTPFLMFVDHIEGEGERLFRLVCERDLEGIVAKHRLSRYVVDNSNPTSVKIRNRRYSQIIGRDELFECRYEEKGAPEIGWETCSRAAAAGRIDQRSMISVWAQKYRNAYYHWTPNACHLPFEPARVHLPKIPYAYRNRHPHRQTETPWLHS